jgi:hypothetical protein
MEENVQSPNGTTILHAHSFDSWKLLAGTANFLPGIKLHK